MAVIITENPQKSGIALGGIGTGSVELFPDGDFHAWQIANAQRWASRCWEGPADDGEGSTGALSFWVRAEREGSLPVVRKLGMKTAWQDFTYRMFPWNKPVERIVFDGRFPVCDLAYQDGALPVDVRLRAVAPFVPHRTDLSATPGFYLDFTLFNPYKTPVTVSLLSSLEPSFCNRDGCENEVCTDGGRTGIFLNALPSHPWEEKSREADRGSLCLSASCEDGEISYITADNFRFLREYVAEAPYGVSQESFLFGFRETGELPDTTVGKRPEPIPEKLGELTDEAVDRRIRELAAYPIAQSLLRRVRAIKPDFPSNREEKEVFLDACRSALERMGDRFGSCALCGKTTLKPGERKKIRFILSWFFPNHYSATGTRLGHWYENRFSDARAVNRFLAEERERIAGSAARFADLLTRTSLPEVYADSWSGHLSTIVKDSWYLKDGKFGLWEGLGFCGFHTTDITWHASFGLLALFPDLQLGQMEMGAAHQREDGRVHHFFTPDLDHTDNGFDRVDMNHQFVAMVCRDYLCTGDRGYLERLWVPVQKAMDSMLALDTDGDGLPDRGTKRNTYDAWNFSGTPAYISVLWISALKAAALLASVLGDEERRRAWVELRVRSLASLEKRLWNGRYYNLWKRDGKGEEGSEGSAYDASLMTAQLDGEWFLRVSGIGGNLRDERVRSVLSAVMEKNYTRDGGLVNATPAEPVSLMTYKNCQAEANWTGIGYAVAALALTVGDRETADKLVGTIHENQKRFGALWDHWECGFRYTRPLSSWTTMNAASGLSVDAEKKLLRLSPAILPLTVPVVTCFCSATAVFGEKTCVLTVHEGSLEGWVVEGPAGTTVEIRYADPDGVKSEG